jgi:hypothetical protein
MHTISAIATVQPITAASILPTSLTTERLRQWLYI